MTRNIVVEEFKQAPLEDQKLEIVERKGIGHPDSICDAVLDSVSVELSKEYLRRFGVILHHNADKSLLVAGEVETRFGGGEVKQPMLLIFGDRATVELEGTQVPVKEIAINAAKKWIKENLRFVDPDEHIRYQVELKPGSAALTDIFKRGGQILSANDTSAAVGYAPMTPTEQLVLKTERFLNSKKFKKEFPMVGEDVKVMGFRKNHDITLTVGAAFVDRFVEGEEDYFKRKEEILEQLRSFVGENGNFKRVELKLNTLDMKGRGVDGVYLTVLGTSADGADSGQVGRGNRPNGVIPLNRHVGSEAAAGKNPVSHVGKIYNILTHKIANEIHSKVPDLREVYVWLVSQIGKPIDQPAIAAARVITKQGVKLDSVRDEIRKIVDNELERIGEFCEDLAKGKYPVC
ncbi:MAG: methionine adenosyltransferase [Hadesarchaea archaeon]|nr:MAG: methionine adenosyltransferase [Hadesarchaea archaeon]HDI12624.1 methionine adenosyltransferase [Hadesarchaea archaeon]